MVTSKLNFKIEHSLTTSVLLHGGLLLLAAVSLPQKAALPLGTDLAYVELAEPSISSAKVIQKSSVITPAATIEDSKASEAASETANTAKASTASMGITGQGVQSGATQGREGVANGTEVAPEDRYLFELKKLLERKKIYPQMARAMGYAGTVRVEFTLGREGEIQALRVSQSAHPVLDEAAQKLVRSIEKQKPFPAEIAKTQWTIEVPIEYSLR